VYDYWFERLFASGFWQRKAETKKMLCIVRKGGEHMDEKQEWHMPEVKELDVSSTESSGGVGGDGYAQS